MTVSEFINKVGFQVDESTVSSVNSTISNIKSTATKLLGTIGIGISLSALNSVAEEFNQINDRINGIVSAEEDAKEVQQGILEAANACKTSYADMASNVESLVNMNSDLFPIEDATVFAEYVQKIGLAAGYSDSEISSMQSSLQRIVAAGTASSSDITRMLRSTPALAKQLADALGVATDELSTMADAGELTAQTIKDAILGSTDSIDTAFDQLDYSISDALLNIRNQWGFWVDSVNSSLGISQTIAKTMVKGFNGVMSVLNSAKDAMVSLNEKLGGGTSLFKLIAIAAGAFAAVLAASKIASFVKDVEKLGKAFSNLKILGVAAALIVLALIVEDFINFMQGNNSVIGTFFDKAGIGADNAREAIVEAWENVTGFLSGVWDTIKEAAGMFSDTVVGFFKRHGESIYKNFERAWGLVKEFLSGVWTFISQLASALFGDTEDSIDGSTEGTKDRVLGTWQTILEALSAVWDALYEAGSAIFNAIATVIEVVFGWIQTFWNSWGSTILSWFKTLWDSIGGVLNGFLEIIEGVANFISSVFTGDWQGAWEAIKQIFSGVWEAVVSIATALWETIKTLFQMGLAAVQSVWETIWGGISSFFTDIWNGITDFLSGIVDGIVETVGNIKDSIVDGIQEAIDWIKSLPEQALQWGADIIQGIADGITGAISTVTDAVSGVAEKIKSFLHFSVPDEGPLTDYESWMPDMMEGLAEGIGSSEDTVIGKVKSLAGNIADSLKGADIQGVVGGIQLLGSADSVSASTAQAATGGAVSNSRNVNQNVNINNTFNGDKAIQQKAASTMESSAEDVTASLARGLAYAR